MWKPTASTVLRLACLAAAVAAGPVLPGCDKPKPEAAAAAKPPPANPATVPAGFVLDKAPDGVQDLAAVKSSGVKDGDEITVRAVVGGEEKPFKPDVAVVRVMDPSVMTCDKMGMDKDACPTPWDACCHQKDATAKGATVRVVGADGAPVKGTLESVGGLRPGAAVVVKGKAKSEGASGLVIEATNVYVVKG